MFISKDQAQRDFYLNNKWGTVDEKRIAEIIEERERKRSAMQKHRLNNPLKYKARKAVYINLRNGKLQKQPCEKCGDSKVEAHHEDYNQPLKVIWVCKRHHIELDKLLKNVVKPLKND